MLGSSLSSSCVDGEEGTQVATHAAVGWFHVCMLAKGRKGGEGGVSLSL